MQATATSRRWNGPRPEKAPREREYAYDRQSKVGKLDKALDEATAKG